MKRGDRHGIRILNHRRHRSSFTLSPILSTDFSPAAVFSPYYSLFSRSVPESGMNVPAPSIQSHRGKNTKKAVRLCIRPDSPELGT